MVLTCGASAHGLYQPVKTPENPPCSLLEFSRALRLQVTKPSRQMEKVLCFRE